ncbi:SpoIIE family protein phosphatase [Streptomyces sp. NPDC094038]|uniref:SpoIIE family protein phosphatase n=1 Tax=Streptomyces sp. NPDC094038 TaxID=3366055 RepID=UPI0038137AA9
MADDDSDTGPATILVIDDSDTNRYVLASWLRRSGHTVLEASDAAQGLAHLAAGLPDIAIIDVRLPDMSGFDVSERIKQDPRTAGLPVIQISAAAITPEDHAEGLRRGADAYLDQPVDPDELLATVTATLRYTRARQRAERLATRLMALNQATLDVYSAIGFHSFAAAAAGGAAAVLDCPATAVFLSPQGQAVHSTVAAPPARPHTLPADPLLLERLAAHCLGDGTGASIAHIPQARWRGLLPGGHLLGDTVLAVARTKRGRPPVCVAVPSDAVTGSDDEQLLQQLVHACALALEALRAYDEEHSLALALQRSFLPALLPTVEGVDLAFRYLPASANAEIGGDFYEALQTDNGLLLAIGDVVGHSLIAATVMGEVRHALRAYAVQGHPPDRILTHLETLLAASQPGITTTLCLVLVEPDRRRAHIANAGHLPPLLISPEGHAHFHTPHGPLLGLGLPHPPPAVLDTPPGTRLILVTDGLVEVRGTDISDSLTDFRHAITTAPTEPESLCDHLLETFGQDKDDDIAILTATLS